MDYRIVIQRGEESLKVWTLKCKKRWSWRKANAAKGKAEGRAVELISALSGTSSFIVSCFEKHTLIFRTEHVITGCATRCRPASSVACINNTSTTSEKFLTTKRLKPYPAIELLSLSRFRKPWINQSRGCRWKFHGMTFYFQWNFSDFSGDAHGTRNN